MEADARPGPISGGRTLPRLALAIAGGLGLVWLVITHTYVDYLAEVDPEAALRIRPSPRAQINFVERRLTNLRSIADMRPAPAQITSTAPAGEGATSSARIDRVRGLADLAARGMAQDLAMGSTEIVPRSPEEEALYQMVRSALKSDPLDARGLRLLGQLTEGHAPREEVAAIMRMAARRNAQESLAVLWLMTDAVARKDYPEVVSRADILLRTRTQLAEHALQALARVCETPKGMALVVAAMRAAPPWRSAFFAHFPRFVSDAHIPLQVFISLKGTDAAPRAEDLRPFMDVLWQNKLYDLAYYAWIQFLPPEQLAKVATPFNGDFALKPSGLPFDWSIPRSPNVTASIVPKPGGPEANVLRIEFGLGRIEFQGVSQILLLPPGPYAFGVQAQALINATRGLVWSVSCVGGTELARSAMVLGSLRSWTPVSFRFVVPETGCSVQQLRLFHDQRSASEQLASGWALFDDVRIARTSAVP